MLALIVQRKV